MPANPAETRLVPNTQPIYCAFHLFCRGGVAAYLLARGPARNLWVPLCPSCARSTAMHLPAELRVDGTVDPVETLTAAGYLVVDPQAVRALGGAGAAEAILAGRVLHPRAEMPPLTQEQVMAYLREHREDAALLEAIAGLLVADGGNEADEERGDDQPEQELQRVLGLDQPAPIGPGDLRCDCGYIAREPNAKAKLGSHKRSCAAARQAAAAKAG